MVKRRNIIQTEYHSSSLVSSLNVCLFICFFFWFFLFKKGMVTDDKTLNDASQHSTFKPIRKSFQGSKVVGNNNNGRNIPSTYVCVYVRVSTCICLLSVVLCVRWWHCMVLFTMFSRAEPKLEPNLELEPDPEPEIESEPERLWLSVCLVKQE